MIDLNTKKLSGKQVAAKSSIKQPCNTIFMQFFNGLKERELVSEIYKEETSNNLPVFENFIGNNAKTSGSSSKSRHYTKSELRNKRYIYIFTSLYPKLY